MRSFAPALVLALLTLMLAFAAPAQAQSPFQPKGGEAAPAEQVQPEAEGDVSLWTRVIVYVQQEQTRLHRALADAIRELRDENSVAAAWGLISLAFLYGLFHAAGPGHGKAVLSAYLVTQPTALRKSLGLAAASSLMQGVTAIVLVYGVIAVLGIALRQSGVMVMWLEAASYALVGLIGLFLAVRGAYRLADALGWEVPGHALLAAGHGHHGHAHEHDHAHDHHHHHDHDHDHAACGHAHVPTPQEAVQAGSLREMAGIIFSIGIRPCSGAVLVLVFAQAMGLTLAGIGAVMAMSAGTALAVGLIALVAVSARDAAWSLSRLDDARVAIAANAISLVGGLVIALAGLVLVTATASQPHPLF